MKHLLSFLFAIASCSVFAQNFESIWDTAQPGTSTNTQITIPTNPAYTYNYIVDWGDGSSDTNVTGDITHTYTTSGSYTIGISGDFPSIYFNNGGDRQKIIEILSWGNIQWQTMENAFYGCLNLNFDAIDSPDLSLVTSLSQMFRDASLFNGIINGWDVGTITDISGIFQGAATFNRPLDNWNTVGVTNMSNTFNGAELFNEPLDNWSTGSVTSMSGMFRSCLNFNQNINNWDVSQVVDMSGMFAYASALNFSLNSWNVSIVENMSSMFEGTTYNLPLSNWDVSSVTNMLSMFAYNTNFNQNINNWDVSAVTDMSGMFLRATSFNQPVDSWNVSSVTNMSRMFDGFFVGMNFNQPLNSWNVSAVTDMSIMFRDCNIFNQPLNNWDVGNVVNMSQMFEDARLFNQVLNSWNVSSVTNMDLMFNQALAFNQPIDSWDVSAVVTMNRMFETATAFNQAINSWNVTLVTDMGSMFRYAAAFNQPVNLWNTSSVTDMSYMFEEAMAFDQNLGSWNVANVADMTDMLNDTALSQGNYDNTLIGWAAQTLSANVSLGALNLNYCDGRIARQELIDTYNWAITEDIINCSFVVCTTIISPLDGEPNAPANFNLVWDAAPNATGYTVTVRSENGGVVTPVFTNEDVGNVVSIDFTSDFTPGDVVYALVVPYNDDGPAVGCTEISFTVGPSWIDSADAFKLTFNTALALSFLPQDEVDIELNGDFTYNYSIDWGDGQFDNDVTTAITHTYLTPGVYTIAIIGDYPAHFYNSPDRSNRKLLSIDQWGTQIWMSMKSSFYSCTNFTAYNATDIPNLSQVTDMSGTFEISNFNGNINAWDVSNVTNMERTFIGTTAYNQPLDNWNVGNVTNMSDMFLAARAFNQPIGNWNVSSVTTMRRMFDGFSANMIFNQPLNNWDVSNVTNMETMFRLNINFNQPLDNWNVGNVVEMAGMFESANAFNQNIDNWDVSSVLNMERMFRRASSFNATLNGWDVSIVTNMASMFQDASAYDQPLNLWDVSSVTSMSFMFDNAQSFDQPIGDWDVSAVTTMASMFQNAIVFNQNIINWDVSSVVDMGSMFNGALVFNQPLNNWNVSSVVNMSSMFQNAQSFDQPLNLWNVSAVATMASMFQDALVFNQEINTWDVSSVTLMNAMFNNAPVFNEALGSWNTASVTRMDTMFKDALVFDQPIGNWDTGEVLTTAEMFSGATVFNQLIDGWNVSFVTTMESMFQNAIAYNQTMNSWNVASVTTMRRMFSGATIFNGSIDSWNVRRVSTMEEMFDGAQQFNQTINSWRVSGVSNMNRMFRNASAINQTFDRWDLGAVSMRSMFENATALDQYFGDWNVGGVSNMLDMLDNTGLSRTNYDNTLIAWSGQSLTVGINLGAESLLYCDAQEERQSMIDNFGWTFTDDILDCPIPLCTQLVAPANGDIDVPVNTNLNWEATTYASSYRLTVRVDPGNITLVNNEIVNGIFYDFATDFSGGETVYVTLIPFNVEGDAIGCLEESFIIANAAPPIPECATLMSPLNAAIDVAVDTDLQWTAVANADGYRITVGTSSGSNDIIDDIDVGSVTSYDIPSDLPESTTLYVMLTPYNTIGDAVGCIEENFTTGIAPVPPTCTTLVTPLNGATNVAVGTDLSWNAVADATGYLVVVGNSSGGIEIVNNVDVGNTTTYNIPDDLGEDRVYYVTIIPYNEVGDASACIEESFRTALVPPVPSCTTLNSPLNNATNVAVGTDLSWNAIADATGYRISVGTTSGGTDILNNSDVGNVTNLNLTADLPENTQIFVSLTPYNAGGDAMACTEESFTTEIIATIPNCTVLTSPLNGASDVLVGTDLSWNAIADATGYKISVGTTSGGTDILNNSDVGNVTTLNLSTDLSENTQIYVTIIPYNAVGDAVGCAEESFTTGALATIPNCTTLTSPLNGSIDVGVGTDLSWNVVIDATGYRISVGTSSGGTDILNNSDIGNVTTLNLAADLPENTEVFVTIIPYNTMGDAIGCAEESFTTEIIIGNNIPDCTSLMNPLSNDTEVPLDTDLSWNAVTSATAYRVSVGTSSGGVDILDNQDVGNVVTFNLTEDLPENTQIFVMITPYNSVGDALGCAEESFITVESAEDLIESEYGFSPNGDGINDFWEIRGIENSPVNVVSIYNRWGDMVFTVNNYDNGRNVFRGVANASTDFGADILPSGTYFFDIQVTGTHNLKKLKGFVVIKR